MRQEGVAVPVTGGRGAAWELTTGGIRGGSVLTVEVEVSLDRLVVVGARQHNLKDVSLSLPRGKVVVFTGPSGSGKSSLAFDTIYAEGQRRYVESLSAYARQFLERLAKPNVERIDGLSPAIAIEQRPLSKSPRS